ncbi:hypothetical protein HHI36_021342 [Cryptolaemus montrouzieri]|uniref:Uncharacterized protein n=1 Tax=Cryptolaemus montrouzieri TaxID=559131 RepID=A0ABD2MXH5_9CUCU
MSIKCSIPGCNGRNNFSKLTKLYRVPAIALGCNDLIYSLTENRRKKWFEALENCELNEANSSSYRVCSKHFVDGKPSPLFDTKSKDWIPNLNLPGSEIQEVKPVENVIKEKRKRGRARKTESEIKSPISSKNIIRSKSVGPSIFREYTVEPVAEKKESDQPFVFVDIQKIKEGKTQTPVTEHSPSVLKTSRARSASPKMRYKRSFATQTNPNILPPIHWGRNKMRKQTDPRYNTVGVQTFPGRGPDASDSVQASLGEMIEFIRKHMLEFNLKALGNHFKIKECALHFEQEGEDINQKDKDSNMVLVHNNKLLSSNWPLLESVAMSLDLYRLEQKNDDSSSAGFVRTVCDKTEIIEKTSDILGEKERLKIKRNRKTFKDRSINEDNQRISMSSEEHIAEKATKPLLSPVLPKISSVISLCEDDAMASEASSPVSKKLTTVSVPSVCSVPKVTRLAPKSSASMGSSSVQSSKTTPSKAIPFEGDAKVQEILGTSKVPRINLRNLPHDVMRHISKNGSISSGIFEKSVINGKRNEQLKEKAQNVEQPVLWVPNVSGIGVASSEGNTSKGVAGYLLLPNTGVASNSTPIMYIPKQGTDQILSSSQNLSLQDLTGKNLPGIPTLVIAPGVQSGITTSALLPKQQEERSNPTGNIVDVKGPEDIKKASKIDGVTLRCPYCLKQCKDGVDFINHHKITGCKGGQQTNPVTKCERCKLQHAKGAEHTCGKADEVEKKQFPDCNVCGRIFARYAFLANHVKTHSEYSKWTNKCPECPKKFPSEEELSQHQFEWHFDKIGKEKFNCDKCKKKFTTKRRLECHIEKSHAPPKEKKCVIRIRCKICREVFELDHYKEVHWKECQEKCLIDDRKEEILNQTEEVKKPTAWRTPIVEKKPTAIRSRVEQSDDEVDPLEKQLTQMFKEQNSADSSHSEYECEEVLNESYEQMKVKDINTEEKVNKKSKKRKRRFMNLEGSEEEFEDFKAPKLNEPNKNDEDVLNNGISVKIEEPNGNLLNKIDIQSLLNSDNGSNVITIEEMEDDEYNST